VRRASQRSEGSGRAEEAADVDTYGSAHLYLPTAPLDAQLTAMEDEVRAAEPARGWARPPCRRFKIRSCRCAGSAFEVVAKKAVWWRPFKPVMPPRCPAMYTTDLLRRSQGVHTPLRLPGSPPKSMFSAKDPLKIRHFLTRGVLHPSDLRTS
jgi:hypothetical protein